MIELLEEETISRFRASWYFLALRNVGKASTSGRFFVAGYPSQLLIKRGNLLGGTLMTAYTDRMNNPPLDAKPPADLRFDLFFHYAITAETLGGQPANLPDLFGVSGASVWQYESRTENKFWTPEAAIRVIGVEKSYKRGEYFRATSWMAVAEILRRTDPELSIAIEREIDGNA